MRFASSADISRARFVSGAGAALGLLTASRVCAQTPAGATTLRIGIIPSDGITAVAYANEAGLFTKAGLDVQLMPQSSGSAIAAGVVAGDYDIGESSTSSLLVAHERGVPFTIVASAGVYDSRSIFSGSITLKDSPLHFGADANGATFGVPSLSDIGHDAFCAWVDQHGGSSSTLRFVEIPFTLSAAAVEQQRVVAAELAAPGLTAALDTGKFRLLPIYNAIAPTFLLSACFTTTEFAAKNTDALRRFARVVTAAGAYANGHHAETVPMMAKLSGIPADQLLHMPRALQGVKVTPELIQPVIAAAAKYGSLKNSFPAQELIDADVIA